MKRMANEWASFRELVIPAAASDLQVDEMHRAFYAGGLAIFSAMMTGVDDSPEPSEADLAAVDALHKELVDGCADHVLRDADRDPPRRPS